MKWDQLLEGGGDERKGMEGMDVGRGIEGMFGIGGRDIFGMEGIDVGRGIEAMFGIGGRATFGIEGIVVGIFGSGGKDDGC